MQGTHWFWMTRLFFMPITMLFLPATTTGEPAQTGTVLLTLVEGVAPAAANDRETRDMELELTLRDGQFDKKVWGFAIAFNKADHEGEIVSAEGERLTVKMRINRDRWFPPAPGEAEYHITLKREDDRYTGTFTGTFSHPCAEGPVKNDVKGTVRGKVYPLWTQPVPGFTALEPREHPRLIFRKSDLPIIKRRLETPEGKAIMQRFLAALPRQHAKSPKNQPFFPAGYALAYQLTGEKAHAEKAKELLAGMLNLSGSQDIHYGPMAQAMAVTLDLCYDAWDAEFRQKVIDNLARRVRDLFTLSGGAGGGASMSPWHNHEGIRAGSAGVAAICLLGEKTSDGREIPDLERMVHIFARSTRRYFQFNGTSNTGFCLEGNFYKRMTWNSGPGHMIQAYRTALGGNLLAGWPGHWSILGEWMAQPPADQVVRPEGLGDAQTAGMWPIGLVTVPDEMKAGARWLFDRAYGLEGNQSFAIFWAYHAGYLLMNYPFDVPPQPPSLSLPWVAPDPTGGHWIFRRPWQDGKDSLVVLHLRSDIRGGCHYNRSGRTWDMQLFALGRQWVGDRTLTEAPGNGVALPLTGIPGAINTVLGPKVTYWNTTADGKAVLSLDMTPVYLEQLAKGAAPPAGREVVNYRRFGAFIDHGVRAKRHVAIDLSGTSGAPLLMVFIDRAEGAKGLIWNLRLSPNAGAAQVEDNAVVVGESSGLNLRCAFIAPKTPMHNGTIKAIGGDEYFVVLTVQNGVAPTIAVEGEGLAARVRVGKQTVSFDGEKIVLGK
jgi:hypothetical protein